METLFVSRDAVLKRKENTLFISVNGEARPFPIEKIRHIVLMSESRLNSRLLCLCGANGVRISVFDYYGYFKGAFEPIDQSASGRVKLEQARSILDPSERMGIARELVRGAGHNMRANLLYYRYRGEMGVNSAVQQMDALMERIGKAPDPPGLMGMEGQLHQQYYAAWRHIDPGLDFGRRVRRPPNNPINCLISFLNQMTYAVVRHETCKTHLDGSLSWLHAPGNGRSSLSLDLSEPFKPLFTDVLIFRMTRKRMIKDNWFEQHDGVCLLTELGRRHVAEQFSGRLEETVQKRTYREWVYREALNLERHVMGIAEYESFKRRL
ncbi:MAG: CRISPR-associated endonuclease Cas1 [Deltaproteobacteria bacterium]|nr:CRISPR-associated endonuclease Cas1 [Deltaproteobacteria bacterium]